jgi:hypothetical protein
MRSNGWGHDIYWEHVLFSLVVLGGRVWGKQWQVDIDRLQKMTFPICGVDIHNEGKMGAVSLYIHGTQRFNASPPSDLEPFL